MLNGVSLCNSALNKTNEMGGFASPIFFGGNKMNPHAFLRSYSCPEWCLTIGIE
jgi:hypothetical protein